MLALMMLIGKWPQDFAGVYLPAVVICNKYFEFSNFEIKIEYLDNLVITLFLFCLKILCLIKR